jgi:hypothetical protein
MTVSLNDSRIEHNLISRDKGIIMKSQAIEFMKTSNFAFWQRVVIDYNLVVITLVNLSITI